MAGTYSVGETKTRPGITDEMRRKAAVNWLAP